MAAGSLCLVAGIVPTAASAVTCNTVAACVLGQNTSTGPGVEADSTSGYGLTASTSFAATSSAHAAGVLGNDKTHVSTDHYNYGVLGTSFYGIGVGGTSSTNYAVTGTSTSNTGIVGKTNYNATGSSGKAGVAGYDDSTNGAAVNAGVLGVSPNGTGIEGTSSGGYGGSGSSTSSAGLVGQSQSGAGIVGQSIENGPGVNGISGTGYGVGAFSSDGATALLAVENSSSGVAVLAQAVSGGEVFDGYNSAVGDVASIDASGNMVIAGGLTQNKPAIVRTSASNGEDVATYGTRSTSAIVEDMGEARIVAGHAFVSLDPTFASIIDKGVKYLVFLTPEGDTRGLFASGFTASGFKVTESCGGRSTLAFDYRIVAKPYGATSARMPSMNLFPKLRRHRAIPAMPLPERLATR